MHIGAILLWSGLVDGQNVNITEGSVITSGSDVTRPRLPPRNYLCGRNAFPSSPAMAEAR